MKRPDFGPGWSLWLAPADEFVHGSFNSCISQLAMRYHDGPLFPPHITLQSYLKQPVMSQEGVVRCVEQVVEGMKPFTVELARTPRPIMDDYFKAIVLPAVKTVSLMELNLKARELLDGLADSPYWPHMSLAYGKIDPDVYLMIGCYILERSLPTSMLVNSIDLYAIPNSDPRMWEHVKKFPFSS